MGVLTLKLVLNMFLVTVVITDSLYVGYDERGPSD